MRSVGVVLFWLGAMMAESKCLLIPMAVIAVGATLMFMSNDKEA